MSIAAFTVPRAFAHMARLGDASVQTFYRRKAIADLRWDRMLLQEHLETRTERAPEAAAPHSEGQAASTRTPPTAMRMAFLLSRYPAISHTFLLNEVAGLRALGFEILTASINSPDRALDALPALEKGEANQTFYVKQDRASAALEILRTLLVQPQVLLRGLAAVLRMRGLTLAARMLWMFYLAEALVVGRWMQRNQVRHLHVHFGGPVASVGMLTSIAWKVPYSLTIHGPEELLNTGHHRLREKIAQASFVFCISDFCRSQLCAISPAAAWSKFKVIRLGVDPKRLQPKEDQPAGAVLKLICTGRLVPEKGQRVLIEALVLLRARGIPVTATLIGSGSEELSLRGIITRKGLQHTVELAGALSHVDTLQRVRAADLFVLPSFAEGIPVALMEAMAFAVPCISTFVAGIPELIESGRDGILVAPASVVALADAIASLATNAALRKYLGSCGRERILRDYNLPQNQQLLASTFAELLTTETKSL